MSWQAMAWADSLPIDDSLPMGAYRVLLKMANAADPEGKGVFRTVERLAQELGRDVRSIRRYIKTLLDQKLIVEGDQQLVSHIPANRRPKVYNLNMQPIEEMQASFEIDPSAVTTTVTPKAVDNSPPRGDSVIHRGDSHVHSGVTTAVLHKERSKNKNLSTSVTTSTGARGHGMVTAESMCEDSPTTRHELPGADHPRYGRCIHCQHRIRLRCGHPALDKDNCEFACRRSQPSLAEAVTT